jgi:hypothetical protein
VPKIAYARTNFSKSSVEVISRAITICEAYAQQGYNLTLRQLYYQFVSRDWLPNTQQSYKRLGSIVNDARVAGLIDWDHLEDRTRNLERLAQWDSPENAMDAIAAQFRLPLWAEQPEYVEVWVEKEALADVVSRPAERWFVPYFPCRGYVSQSEMWRAAQRIRRQERNGKKAVIIHLGDHDPSGIDMTRDIEDRLWQFGSQVHVERIALNLDQISRYRPPPNPAKLTDARHSGYVDQFGDAVLDENGEAMSWELDALDPATLDTLIEDTILAHLDRDQWDGDYAVMEQERAVLTAISENWRELAGFVRSSGWVQQGEDED